MAKKTLDEKLWGAAVLRASFALRGQLDAPAFKSIFPGVLRDLEVTEKQVDEFLVKNKDAVEKAARGDPSTPG